MDHGLLCFLLLWELRMRINGYEYTIRSLNFCLIFLGEEWKKMGEWHRLPHVRWIIPPYLRQVTLETVQVNAWYLPSCKNDEIHPPREIVGIRKWFENERAPYTMKGDRSWLLEETEKAKSYFTNWSNLRYGKTTLLEEYTGLQKEKLKRCQTYSAIYYNEYQRRWLLVTMSLWIL